MNNTVSFPLMYNISLDRSRFVTIVNGLNSSIKIISQQILSANNSALALKQLLPELINLNDEIARLDKVADETERILNAGSPQIPSEIAQNSQGHA